MLYARLLLYDEITFDSASSTFFHLICTLYMVEKSGTENCRWNLLRPIEEWECAASAVDIFERRTISKAACC